MYRTRRRRRFGETFNKTIQSLMSNPGQGDAAAAAAVRDETEEEDTEDNNEDNEDNSSPLMFFAAEGQQKKDTSTTGFSDSDLGNNNNNDTSDCDRRSSGIGSLADTDSDECDKVSEISDASIATLLKEDRDEDDSEEDNSTSSCNSNTSNASSSLKIRHFSFGALTALQKSNASQGKSRSEDPKKVRFADCLGLDLVQVQVFDLMDDYKMPNLSVAASGSASSPSLTSSTPLRKTMVPMFQQPSSFPNFLQLLGERKVILENAFLEKGHVSVKGVVRVLNMDYHKAVYIRWTVDEWRSMMDYKASYMKDSNDGFSDKFQFKVYAPLDIGQSLVFAVRFHCVGQQFWDNNNGENYRFVCKNITHE